MISGEAICIFSFLLQPQHDDVCWLLAWFGSLNFETIYRVSMHLLCSILFVWPSDIDILGKYLTR